MVKMDLIETFLIYKRNFEHIFESSRFLIHVYLLYA